MAICIYSYSLLKLYEYLAQQKELIILAIITITITVALQKQGGGGGGGTCPLCPYAGSI